MGEEKVSDYWTKIQTEEEARHKVIEGAGEDDERLVSDNVVDLSVLRSNLGFEKSDVVLDFGCGVGRLMKELKGEVKEIWGYDISPKNIEVAKKYAGVDSFYLMNDDIMVPVHKKFDKIYSTLCFQHIEKCDGFIILDGLLRVLKKGGVLFVQFSNLCFQRSDSLKAYFYNEGLGDVRRGFRPLMRFFTGEELVCWCKALSVKGEVLCEKERGDRLWLKVVKE